jgi:hypothetical protein
VLLRRPATKTVAMVRRRDLDCFLAQSSREAAELPPRQMRCAPGPSDGMPVANGPTLYACGGLACADVRPYALCGMGRELTKATSLATPRPTFSTISRINVGRDSSFLD